MEDLLNSAKSAYKEKNYTQAIEIWSSDELKGHSDALYNLGLMYLQGTGVDRDPAKAVKYFLEAGDNSSALYNLGVIYQNGILGERDDKSAYDFYLKAAELGHKDAMYEIAQYSLFQRSSEVLGEKRTGLDYLIRANEAGQVRAKMQLQMLCPNYESIKKMTVPSNIDTEFRSLDYTSQAKKVESILDDGVREILLKDGGNVAIIDIISGDIVDLRLQYTGNCSGCSLASTSTLDLIRTKLHQTIDTGIRVIAI